MRTERRKVRTIVSEEKGRLIKEKWLLDVGFLWIYEIMLRFCAFWWVIDRREKFGEYGKLDKDRIFWLTGWLVALTLMWATNPSNKIISIVFAILAICRLIEILTTGLGTILNRKQQSRARSVTTIAIYALQSTLIFAILEHTWAGTSFISGATHATSAFDFLFISWSSITNIGNNVYVPASTTAKLLQSLNSSFGVLLLGVLLAFGINAFPKEKD
jgi:hypothetical protein